MLQSINKIIPFKQEKLKERQQVANETEKTPFKLE